MFLSLCVFFSRSVQRKSSFTDKKTALKSEKNFKTEIIKA